MIHKMRLLESPFERTKNRTKTVEFRLYDEKRKQIKIGDKIEFSKLPDEKEKLVVEVIDLYIDNTFEELLKKLDFSQEEIDSKLKTINSIYTKDQEKEYGVLGIKIKLLS